MEVAGNLPASILTIRPSAALAAGLKAGGLMRRMRRMRNFGAGEEVRLPMRGRHPAWG